MPKDTVENCAAIARIIKDFCSCSEVGAWSPVMTEDENTQSFEETNRETFLKTELTNMAAMRKRIITIAKRKGRHWRNKDKPITTLSSIDENKAYNSFEDDDFNKTKHTTFDAQRRENTLIDIYTSSRNYSTCGDNWSLSRVWKNHLPHNILNDHHTPPEFRTNSLKQPLVKPFSSNAHRSKTYGGRGSERNSFRSDRSHLIDRRQMKEQLRYDRNIKRHIRIRFMLSLRMRRYVKRKFPTLPERKPIMGDFQRSRANIPTKEFPRTNSKWNTIDNSSFGTRSYGSVTSGFRREGMVLFDVNEARNEVLSRCHDDWNDMDTLEVALRGGNFRSGRAAVGGWVRGRAMPSARAARAANGALALHYAAARGCLDCVRLLATTTPHASANTAMDNDVTPVYLAAQEGHLEVLKYLVLEAGGELNARARDGMQPVHAAAQTGCLDCLKWMIVERGVDPNSRDGDGATPLHFAASRGHMPTVRWLLRHGARLHLDRHGKSPINDAADNHHVECLNVLVAAEGAGAKQLAAYKGVHACVCRPGDEKCSLPGCTNAGSRTPGAESRRRRESPERAPFYLHAPATPPHAPADGLYVNPMGRKDAPPALVTNTSTPTPAIHNGHVHAVTSGGSSEEESSGSAGGISRSDSGFYLHHLHRPAELIYHRVRDLFDVTPASHTAPRDASPPPPPPALRGRAEGEETPDTGMTVKAEIHSSSSGAGSDGSLSGASDASDVPLVTRLDADHLYEDIYLARDDVHRNRSASRDSGSHSRSGSSSSSSGIVVKLSPQRADTDSPPGNRDMHINTKGQKKQLSEDAPKEKNRHATLQGKLSSLGAKASTFASKLASHASTINKSSSCSGAVSSGGSSGVSSAGCSSDEAGGPPPPPPPPPQPRDVPPPSPPTPPTPPIEDKQADHNTKTNGVRGRRNSIASVAASPTSDVDAEGANDRYSRATPNLVNKQLVLPFVPPSFPHQLHSNRLIKPSEYLRSISASASLDTEDGYQPVEQMKPPTEKQESGNPNAPPPPPPPPQESPATRKHQQPLSAISIQDLNSVQLRRTDKMMASKTLSAPARSMSMQCLATEPFQAQKTDLIAELKMSKDITGIKKMKVERAKMENMVDKEVYSEYTKQYTLDNFVDQVPERDASGNVIPAWKRQMLARRAAERARRDLERRVAGEAERRRALAVPAWKRQLLARREEAEQRLKSTIYQSKASDEVRNGFMSHEMSNENCWRSPSQYGHQRAVSIDNINLAVDYEDRRPNGIQDNNENCMHNGNTEPEDPKENGIVNGGKPIMNGKNQDSDDEGRIIPWRAQLRKTNSKLNLLD